MFMCVVVIVILGYFLQLSLLTKFIEHIMTVKPNIIVTYNGDNFDWSDLCVCVCVCVCVCARAGCVCACTCICVCV